MGAISMKNMKFILLILPLFFFACITTTLIPNGKYVASTGEYIIIEEDAIFYHINLEGYSDELFWDRKLNYNVVKGIISPYTMPSGEYFKTLAPFRFLWENGTIIKESSREKKKTIFYFRGIEAHDCRGQDIEDKRKQHNQPLGLSGDM